MKRILIFLMYLYSLSYFQSQNVDGKKKFDLNMGLEYRMTPFNFDSNSTQYSQNVTYDRDNQLNGTSLLIEINYEILKKIKIGLGQSVRYDELYYSQTDAKMINSLIFDTHVSLKYPFFIGKQKLFALFGYSFMNNNSKYKEEKIFETDENGNPILSASTLNDFTFDAYHLGLGYTYKKFNFLIGTYYIEKEHNFSAYGTSAIGMPYLQVNYNLYNF
ncbi:hypothetical protein [uncultured Chryseobacterium sp.]|uniref:hypothetical protein n=1 Tax=uncultured Chryseobacterium sp. TaxID=259322 RepID=UPI00262366F0|nr:hypothetical protein [uncultured Chryseobacterium sp.]